MVTPMASKRPRAKRRLSKPRRRQAPQSHALPYTQAFERVERRTGSYAARLDLNESEHAVIAGDQVDLAVAGAYVARDHAQAEPLQVLSGELLAGDPKRPAVVRATCVARRSLMPGDTAVRCHATDAREPGASRACKLCRLCSRIVSGL
jgi:hypothetical protein